MASRNPSNFWLNKLADGWEFIAGTIARKLKITGADVIIIGSGTNTYSFPNQSGTVALQDLIYPIGIVITLGVSTNPAILLGFGTWTAIPGRVIVGIDGAQTEFDVLNEIGGTKTHILSSAEMPVHTHVQDAHNHIQNAHAHTVLGRQNSAAGTEERLMNAIATTGGVNNVANGAIAATATNIAATAVNNNAGNGNPHNNLQPYIVKYVWERTG